MFIKSRLLGTIMENCAATKKNNNNNKEEYLYTLLWRELQNIFTENSRVEKSARGLCLLFFRNSCFSCIHLPTTAETQSNKAHNFRGSGSMPRFPLSHKSRNEMSSYYCPSSRVFPVTQTLLGEPGSATFALSVTRPGECEAFLRPNEFSYVHNFQLTRS